MGHFLPAPVPAPHNTGLYAFDGKIVDSTGASVGGGLVPASWLPEIFIGPRYGFSADGSELRLVRSVPFGQDLGPGGISKLGLPVIIETPPFPQNLQLRVISGGQSLNVRGAPGLSAAVVSQLADGAVVTASGDGNDECSPDGGCSVAPDPKSEYDMLWWLYVRAEDGTGGWVRSDFLTWANR